MAQQREKARMVIEPNLAAGHLLKADRNAIVGADAVLAAHASAMLVDALLELSDQRLSHARIRPCAAVDRAKAASDLGNNLWDLVREEKGVEEVDNLLLLCCVLLRCACDWRHESAHASRHEWEKRNGMVS